MEKLRRSSAEKKTEERQEQPVQPEKPQENAQEIESLKKDLDGLIEKYTKEIDSSREALRAIDRNFGVESSGEDNEKIKRLTDRLASLQERRGKLAA